MNHACAARARISKHLPIAASIALLASLAIPHTGLAGDIKWLTGTVRLDRKQPAELAERITTLAARPNAQHIVVQFNGPLTKEKRAELDAAGLELLSYLGDHAFFAALPPGRANVAAIAHNGTIVDVRAINRVWKLHPSLARNEIPDWARLDKPDAKGKKAPIDQVDPIVAVIVQFHEDVRVHPDGVRLARMHNAAIRSDLWAIHSLLVEMPFSSVVALADEDAVKWIEPPLPPMDECNDDNRVRVGANTVQLPPYDLDGTGVNVLIYDSANGLASHPDFGGRLFVRDFEGTSNHSTHVAGTVGGNGALSGGNLRGMAPGVIMQSYGFDVPGGLQPGFLYTDPGDLQANYNEAINTYGVEISNNSIGSNVEPNGYNCAWQGDYGTTAQLIDGIVRGSLGTPFRIVWAAGNERQGSRCDVEGFGDYYSIAPPGAAKNFISVGALNSNNDSVTSFTSWGPTDDGRLKPDVSGPGCQSTGDFGVTSTSSSGGYTDLCGTSMAAPTVCGVGALILEDWHNLYPGEPNPLGSTLKALLVHSAAEVESIGPDYRTGYGSVRAPAAIDLLRSENFLTDEVSQGEIVRLVLIVGPSEPQGKVTLVWDDVPGTPNVSPSLVNDLDLRVYDSGGTRYYPWTLNPLNPSAAAVRTQEDHLNNIEQVVIDAPAPGAYFIEIHGTNVPFGPQAFSITATPQLVACSSQGILTLNDTVYSCADSATIQVIDCDLNTDDNTVETATITVLSDSEPGGESVLLTETEAATATFVGSIPLAAVDAGGTLLVSDGDTLTARYIDADDGMGGTNVVTDETAPVDCAAPIITNVQMPLIAPRDITISFETNEPARPTIHYGSDCGSLTSSFQTEEFETIHTVVVTGLTDNTSYAFTVEAEDEAGNAGTNDNGGACFLFSTPELPDFYTEEFSNDFDLENMSVTLIPDGSFEFYTSCVEPITELPTDPTGGTVLPLADDDSEAFSLTGGQMVLLYGVSYGTVHVGSNGYITFNGGDSDYTESISDHFERPRISGHFDDLTPNLAPGSVSWKQLADRVAVTWLNVREFGSTETNTFQIEMFFDGRIAFNYLSMSSIDSIVGVSEGNGVSPDYNEFDLSASSVCSATPPVANDQIVQTGMDTAVVITLDATDDGLPEPAVLSFVIDTLPTYELRDNGTGTAITAGELPYVLIGAGNQVTYEPNGGYVGPDSFTFHADDGGSPPEGGASNVATVNINVAGNGDFDGDGDVDLTDFATFGQCFGGAFNPPAVGCPPGVNADLDNDGDVDASDFAILTQNFTGSL